jgi:hypothetical protein
VAFGERPEAGPDLPDAGGAGGGTRAAARRCRAQTDRPALKRVEDHTFGEACDAWLAYVAHEKDRRSSTIGDYRNTVRCYLLPEFGADTLLHTIDTARIDAYRERVLVERQLSRCTVQKILVLLHGTFSPGVVPAWPGSRGMTCTGRGSHSSGLASG